MLIVHRLSSSSGCLVGLSAALLRCRLPVDMMQGGLLKARQRSDLLRECTDQRNVMSHERGGTLRDRAPHGSRGFDKTCAGSAISQQNGFFENDGPKAVGAPAI